MASKENYKGWVTVTFGMSLIVIGLLIVSSLAGAVSLSGSHQDMLYESIGHLEIG